jgi:hypothetical protein
MSEELLSCLTPAQLDLLRSLQFAEKSGLPSCRRYCLATYRPARALVKCGLVTAKPCASRFGAPRVELVLTEAGKVA